jgi:hypothetical protein
MAVVSGVGLISLAAVALVLRKLFRILREKLRVESGVSSHE